MKLYKKMILFFAFCLLITACSKDKGTKPSGNLVEVELEPGDVYAVITFMDYGEATFKLFPDLAPIAVGKFISLAERGFYERKTIHRVVQNAFIQGGSLNGDGTDGTIDNSAYFNVETSKNAKNFYGALGFAANSIQKNFCQFYIVNNKQPVDIDADAAILEEQLSDPSKELNPEAKEKYTGNLNYMKKIPKEVKERYLDKGGFYSLDDKSTVFGQIVSGYDVIDKISGAEVVSGNIMDDNSGIYSKPAETIIIESVKIVRIPLPEPTVITEETTTEKSKSAKKRQTKTERPEDAFTDVITINNGKNADTAPPEEETEEITAEPVDTLTDESNEVTAESVPSSETPADSEAEMNEENENQPANATITETIAETAPDTQLTSETAESIPETLDIDNVESLAPPTIEE